MEQFLTSVSSGSESIVGLLVAPDQAHTVRGVPIQFEAYGIVSDGNLVDMSGVVAWASTNRRVAAIDEDGLSRAFGCGWTHIVATFGSMVSDPVRLEVHLPELVELRTVPSMAILPRGTSAPLRAVATLGDGFEIDVTTAAIWSSANPQVAITDGAGRVTAVGEGGAAAVRASLYRLSAQALVVVTSSTLVAVAVEPRVPPTLPVGSHFQFTALGLFSDGRLRDLTQHVEWSVSDERILAVCQSPGVHPGLVAGIAPGVAMLQAQIFDLESMPVAVEVPGGPRRVFVGVDPFLAKFDPAPQPAPR